MDKFGYHSQFIVTGVTIGIIASALAGDSTWKFLFIALVAGLVYFLIEFSVKNDPRFQDPSRKNQIPQTRLIRKDKNG